MSEAPQRTPQPQNQDDQPTLSIVRADRDDSNRVRRERLSSAMRLGEFYDAYVLPICREAKGSDSKTILADRTALKYWGEFTRDPSLEEIDEYDCADFVASHLQVLVRRGKTGRADLPKHGPQALHPSAVHHGSRRTTLAADAQCRETDSAAAWIRAASGADQRPPRDPLAPGDRPMVVGLRLRGCTGQDGSGDSFQMVAWAGDVYLQHGPAHRHGHAARMVDARRRWVAKDPAGDLQRRRARRPVLRQRVSSRGRSTCCGSPGSHESSRGATGPRRAATCTSGGAGCGLAWESPAQATGSTV